MVQQLRILLPLPPFVMTLIIGSLVNLSLVLAGRFTAPAVIWAMSAALPAVAFMQGHLALPFLWSFSQTRLTLFSVKKRSVRAFVS